MSEKYSCHFTDVDTVVSTMVNGSLGEMAGAIPYNELKDMFIAKFPKADDDYHTFTEDAMLEFLEEVNREGISRTLEVMIKEGTIDVLFDAKENDFCFRLTDKGREIAIEEGL